MPKLNDKRSAFFQIVVEAVVDYYYMLYASLTTDIWTSRSQHSFIISLTMHYLDESFEQKFAVIGCMPFDDTHSAD